MTTSSPPEPPRPRARRAAATCSEPGCGRVLYGTSQLFAHERGHRAREARAAAVPHGTRAWKPVIPYWSWEYALVRPDDSGPAVTLTRTEATRGVKTVYTVQVTAPGRRKPQTREVTGVHRAAGAMAAVEQMLQDGDVALD